MQQGTLNSITITIFLKRTSTKQKTISFVAMEKALVVKKLSLVQTAACGSTPGWTLAFPASLGLHSLHTLSCLLLHLPPGRFARREVDIRRSGGSSLGWQSEHPRSKPNIVT